MSLCEVWYNTNWHTALGTSPFEALYGHSPRYFGLSVDDSMPVTDAQQWLNQRAVIQEAIRQHLIRAKQKMKHHGDKKRTERHFAVGDKVFLKLQPYAQSSVVKRASQKLTFKFFGPYEIVQKIGTVAYRLELPSSSRVHPVFHVSQLKPFVVPTHQMLTQLPSPDTDHQIPVQILQRRMIQCGREAIAQVLIQWSDSTPELATWEDLISLQQQFPRASARGQAVLKEGGLSTVTSDNRALSMKRAKDRGIMGRSEEVQG